jgi:hypothetical protein
MNTLQKMTPEEAIESLKKNGYPEELTIKQVKEILDFLYKMTEIAISITLKKTNNDITLAR